MNNSYTITTTYFIHLGTHTKIYINNVFNKNNYQLIFLFLHCFIHECA